MFDEYVSSGGAAASSALALPVHGFESGDAGTGVYGHATDPDEVSLRS